MLNGRYGGEPPRQRFRCIQPTGAKHNFSGTLARGVVNGGARCPTCERPLERHQGAPFARHYGFEVKEVALALERVGGLMSYTDAALRSRATTQRGEAVNRTLVGNWVEVFGPVVAARHAEPAWPETVVLDSTPFYATTPKGNRVVFHVFCAFGYDKGAARGRAVKIVASTRNDGASWSKVLSSKQGQPKLLVADKDTGLLAGAFSAWPTVTWRRCRWHLYENLDAQLSAYGIHYTPKNPHTLTTLGRHAFSSPTNWVAFRTAIMMHGGANLVSWARSVEGDLAPEFLAGPLPRHYSNGAAENVLDSIKAPIATRAFCYRNAERTNRLLELVRLRVNRLDSVETYAKDIGHYLENGGPLRPQGKVVDPKGRPSLR